MIRKKLKAFISVGTENDSIRYNWVKNKLENLPDDIRLLDAGAGELKYKKYCKHLNYVSQDFGEYDGSGDDKGLQTGEWDAKNVDIISDIVDVPEKDSSFDAILCSEVFEHLPNPIKALDEFSRLLKPGGHLIITAPFCSLTHFAPFHFYSGFNFYFYKEHLEKNGYKIIEVNRNGNFFKYLAQELMRLPFVVKKYSNSQINLFDKMILFLTLILIKRLEKKNLNSEELLCFGYHIYAIKNKEI